LGGAFLPFCPPKKRKKKEYSTEKSLVLKRNKSPKKTRKFKNLAKIQHNWPQHERCLRFFYFHVLNTAKFG
jgi:hypothetical protein